MHAQVGDPNYGYRNQTFSFLNAPLVSNTSSVQVLINADPVRCTVLVLP